jgi:virulence-associated protein VapD
MKVKTNDKTWIFCKFEGRVYLQRKYIEQISAVLNFKVSCRQILWKFTTVIKMFRPLK